jgi:hypothetical protein
MPNPSRARSSAEEAEEAQRAERLATVIGASVMKALGQPADLFRVSVVRLWGNRYRVNVQTGADVASARIAHSYFLTVDESGQVIASDPAIARLYE